MFFLPPSLLLATCIQTPEVQQMDPFGYIASFIFNSSLLMLSRLHVMFFSFYLSHERKRGITDAFQISTKEGKRRGRPHI